MYYILIHKVLTLNSLIIDYFFVNLYHKTIENSTHNSSSLEIKLFIMIDAAELIDNDFLRQFEIKIDDHLAKIEYSLQDRKIFLTKLVIPKGINDENFSSEFLSAVFDQIDERNLSIVPTSPDIAKFVRRNRKYKRMLPVGLRI